MSQHVNLEVALTLKRGDVLYHNIIEFGGIGEVKTPATCRVLGRVRVLGYKSVEKFSLPVVRCYGDKARTEITWMSRDLWRTTPQKLAPRGRVVRSRGTVLPSPVTEEPQPVPRRVSRPPR